jgi:hypothetical protein
MDTTQVTLNKFELVQVRRALEDRIEKLSELVSTSGNPALDIPLRELVEDSEDALVKVNKVLSHF